MNYDLNFIIKYVTNVLLYLKLDFYYKLRLFPCACQHAMASCVN